MTSWIVKYLSEISPNFHHLTEFPIGPAEAPLGWNSYAIDAAGGCIAGGTADRRHMARRKAVAESLERAFIEKLKISAATEFMLDRFPDSRGFAVGFLEQPTQLRSIADGIEMTIRDHLGDGLLVLDEIKNPETTPLEHFLAAGQDIRYFKLDLVDHIESFHLLPELTFHMVVAEDGKLGSVGGFKVAPSGVDAWEHALVELRRNQFNLNSFRLGKAPWLKGAYDAGILTLNFQNGKQSQYSEFRVAQILSRSWQADQDICMWRSLFVMR